MNHVDYSTFHQMCLGLLVRLTCPEILAEFSEKLTGKFELSAVAAENVVAELLQFLHSIRIPNQLEGATTDADDNKVIECAVVVGATHIISGDRKHLLRLGRYEGILIVSAADFLAQFP